MYVMQSVPGNISNPEFISGSKKREMLKKLPHDYSLSDYKGLCI